MQQLKKLNGRVIEERSKELLRMLNLTEKSDSFVCKLSGGMKRKLSLAIALIGNPSVRVIYICVELIVLRNNSGANIGRADGWN